MGMKIKGRSKLRERNRIKGKRTGAKSEKDEEGGGIQNTECRVSRESRSVHVARERRERRNSLFSPAGSSDHLRNLAQHPNNELIGLD